MNTLTLTPKAEQLLWMKYPVSEDWRMVAEWTLKDPALIKAQGLFTRDEVREMIVEAYACGSRPHYRTPYEYAEDILSTPKTDNHA